MCVARVRVSGCACLCNGMRRRWTWGSAGHNYISAPPTACLLRGYGRAVGDAIDGRIERVDMCVDVCRSSVNIWLCVPAQCGVWRPLGTGPASGHFYFLRLGICPDARRAPRHRTSSLLLSAFIHSIHLFSDLIYYQALALSLGSFIHSFCSFVWRYNIYSFVLSAGRLGKARSMRWDDVMTWDIRAWAITI